MVRPPNKRLSYHLDHEHELRWIVHRKSAGTSIRAAMGPYVADISKEVGEEKAHEYDDYFTVSFVRHPWDRIVSALHSVMMDGRAFVDRVDANILERDPMHINTHAWPQHVLLDGFRVDFLGQLEHMARDWANLRKLYPHLLNIQHVNRGRNRPRRWRKLYDWSKLLPIYGEDFALCGAWKTS